MHGNPDHFIFHIGTNDLNSDKSPKLIAKSVAGVGSSLENESRNESISSITVRIDKFKEKAAEVNDYFERPCAERNIYFMNPVKNILPYHLGNTRLHLNRKGSSILSSNFAKPLSDIFK